MNAFSAKKYDPDDEPSTRVDLTIDGELVDRLEDMVGAGAVGPLVDKLINQDLDTRDESKILTPCIRGGLSCRRGFLWRGLRRCGCGPLQREESQLRIARGA